MMTMLKNVDLQQEIETARSIDQLRTLGAEVPDIVRQTIRTEDAETKSIVQLISRFNDAITRRLIDLLASTESVRLPDGVTYLALGSEGRCEQTLSTDQDSAIVYRDDLSAEKLRDVERFAIRIGDALDDIGISRCPGNIMACNPQWRHSLSEWKRLLDQWITVPTPEHMLDFCMFQDLRSLHGSETLGTQLRNHIRATVRLPAFFFPNMACHAVRFPAPFTMFGRIRVEPRGEHRGQIDIKKAGIFALTVGTSLLALEAGIVGGTTWEKLELLGKRRVITPGDLGIITRAFDFLVQLRLQLQLRSLAAGIVPNNYVDPLAMTDKERGQFRQALKGVNTFLRMLRGRYQLDFISS